MIKYYNIGSCLLPLLLLAGCSAPTEKTAEPVKEDVKFESVSKISGDDVMGAVISGKVDSERLKFLAKKECGTREFCKVLVWDTPSNAATAFPMTDTEVSSQIFAYSVNRASGFEQSMWDCEKYHRDDKNQCL